MYSAYPAGYAPYTNRWQQAKKMIYKLSAILLILISSCNSKNNSSIENTATKSSAVNAYGEMSEIYNTTLEHDFDNALLFGLKDTIKADINGDGYVDKAIIIQETNKTGLLIIPGNTHNLVKIGFGEKFGNWDNFDLDWVSFWGLVNDSVTNEILIEEGEIVEERKVRLENPSIVLRKNQQAVV